VRVRKIAASRDNAHRRVALFLKRTKFVLNVHASTIDKLLGASRLFGTFPEPLRTTIAARATRRAYVRGERIFRTGEPANRFNLVLSGVIKIVKPIADGTEAIVGLFGPRESIGDPAVLEHTNYPADAVVASHSAEILSVEAAPVLAVSNRSAEVASAILRVLLDHTHALQEKIGVMSAGSVPKRLATLFLALGERFGDEIDDDTLVIPVPLSRGELACLVGARVETTIRTVRRWERAGILETRDDGFSIKNIRALIEETRARGSRGD
jgi:CRP-like cAMP-binding protein